MFVFLRIPVRGLARLRKTACSGRLPESTMPRGNGNTARTILPRQLRTLVEGGSLPLRHGGAAPIPKQRLQSEILSLFLRLFFCCIRIDCWLRFSFQADNQRAISA